ncbi:MAG: hypothetical protein KUG80_04440 [Gammaproteobacteria bacterium]|nr:hypothetical protein [Gammaproteobacteria bacterium]
MKKILLPAVIPALLLTASVTEAGEFTELFYKIVEARDSLITFAKDKDKQGRSQQKLVRDTANTVSITIANMSPPAGKEAEFEEMLEIWANFKRTREEELLPLILAGKEKDALSIAMGLQKQRLSKVLMLCDTLDQHK